VDVTKLQELKNWFSFWHFRVKQWGGFMIHVIFSSLPMHFPSHHVFMACLNNSFENEIIKQILCFVEIHFGKTYGHAHLQPHKNNA
jgi:hypothetical protein